MVILPALNTNNTSCRSDPEGCTDLKTPVESHPFDLTDRSKLASPNLLQVFISHVGDCRWRKITTFLSLTKHIPSSAPQRIFRLYSDISLYLSLFLFLSGRCWVATTEWQFNWRRTTKPATRPKRFGSRRQKVNRNQPIVLNTVFYIYNPNMKYFLLAHCTYNLCM